MDELQILKQENEEMKNKIIELEERLKKYTAPQRHKKYYENHKEEILEKQKEYVVSSEKKKGICEKSLFKKEGKKYGLKMIYIIIRIII